LVGLGQAVYMWKFSLHASAAGAGHERKHYCQKNKCI